MTDVYSSSDPVKLHYIRSMLEESGIEVSVCDEQMNNFFPHYSLALGGLRIQVKDDDVPQALEMIKDLERDMAESKPVENEADQNPDGVPFQDQYVKDYHNELACPVCGNNEIEVIKKDARPVLSAIVSMLFLIPVPVRKKYLRCGKCGAWWSYKEISFLKMFLLIGAASAIFFLIWYLSRI